MTAPMTLRERAVALLRAIATAVAGWLRTPMRCPWCGVDVDPATAVRGAGGAWCCSDEHAALDQEISGP